MSYRKNPVAFMAGFMILNLGGGLLLAASDDYYQEIQANEQTQKAVAPMPAGIPGSAGTLQSIRDLTGRDLLNAQGVKLGVIDGCLIDSSRNEVCYVVLKEHNRFYPVPWAAIGAGEHSYVLNITPDRLREAPGFDSIDPAKLSGMDTHDKLHAFYVGPIATAHTKVMTEKSPPAMSRAANFSLHSTRQILGMKIENSQDKRIGDLRDIVFDVRKGNCTYGLVDYWGIWSIGQREAAVPWSVITIQYDHGIARLDADRKTLDSVAIRRDDIQRLTEPVFASKVQDSFGREPYGDVYGFVPPSDTSSSNAAWAPDSAYNRRFDPSTVTTLQCRIRGVGSFRPEKNAAPGLELKVETPAGETYTVYAGPQDYYRLQSVRFAPDDRIIVTGSKTKVDNKAVIMASSIQKGSMMVILRDADGKPAWSKFEMP
jgi:sporulation protein YlmC with PRC-barrel domain